MNSQEFAQLLVESIDPNLSMYLLKESEKFAVYAGLWGTWELNDTNLAAKVVFVTVLKGSPKPAPRGPMSLDALLPWVTLQMHHIDQESPVWESTRTALSGEFERMLTRASAARCRPGCTVGWVAPWHQPAKLQYSSASENLNVRKFQEPSQLAAFVMNQATGEEAEVARPPSVLNRRRVAYLVDNVSGGLHAQHKTHAHGRSNRGAGVRGEKHSQATVAEFDGGGGGAGPHGHRPGGHQRVEDLVCRGRSLINAGPHSGSTGNGTTRHRDPGGTVPRAGRPPVWRERSSPGPPPGTHSRAPIGTFSRCLPARRGRDGCANVAGVHGSGAPGSAEARVEIGWSIFFFAHRHRPGDRIFVAWSNASSTR